MALSIKKAGGQIARILTARILAATVVAVSIGLGAGLAEAKSPTIFQVFDSAVISMVASGTCHTANVTQFKRFSKSFNQVYSEVEARLMDMNPGKTRKQIQMLIGFRTAQLEVRTEDKINSLGCDHPDVKKVAQLLDLRVTRDM